MKMGKSLLMVLMLAGCTDGAAAGLAQCEQLRTANKPEAALAACNQAVATDPNSKAGKAATALAMELTKTVAQLKAEHDAALEQQQRGERERLLNSDNPEDWRELVKDSPETAEAKEATTKVDKVGSLCLDGGTDSFVDFVLPLDDFPGDIVKVDQSFEAADVDEFRRRGRKLHRRIDVLRTLLSDRCRDYAKHQLRPGEEVVQKQLAGACQGLDKLYGDWLTAIDAFGGLEPFVALKERAPKIAESAMGAGRMQKCLDLAAGRAAAGKANSASQAAPSTEVKSKASDDANALVSAWLQAQNQGAFAAYQNLYAPDFTGVKRVGTATLHFNRTSWLNDRKGMFLNSMVVTATSVEVEDKDGDVVVRFTQRWASGNYADEGTKEMSLKKVGNQQLIVREELLNSKVVQQ